MEGIGATGAVEDFYFDLTAAGIAALDAIQIRKAIAVEVSDSEIEVGRVGQGDRSACFQNELLKSRSKRPHQKNASAPRRCDDIRPGIDYFHAISLIRRTQRGNIRGDPNGETGEKKRPSWTADDRGRPGRRRDQSCCHLLDVLTDA